MRIQPPWRVVWLLAPCVAIAAPPPRVLSFEDMVGMSDRIIVGTVQGTSAGSARLPDGREIALGIKDAATGFVFTPYRVRVATCLFDKDDSCRPGDLEVVVPGGTIYEFVDGGRRLRTWEVAGAAGAPLPPAGDEVLLFMTKRNDRYVPLNDSAARARVDRSPGTASVVLRFESPRFLSDEGRESARERVGAANPAITRPVFVETVPLDRLKALVALARQAPKPSSGTRHAIPGRADANPVDPVRQPGHRVRTGDDADGSTSVLGVRDRCDPIHRSDDHRRACGP